MRRSGVGGGPDLAGRPCRAGAVGCTDAGCAVWAMYSDARIGASTSVNERRRWANLVAGGPLAEFEG